LLASFACAQLPFLEPEHHDAKGVCGRQYMRGVGHGRQKMGADMLASCDRRTSRIAGN